GLVGVGLGADVRGAVVARARRYPRLGTGVGGRHVLVVLRPVVRVRRDHRGRDRRADGVPRRVPGGGCNRAHRPDRVAGHGSGARPGPGLLASVLLSHRLSPTLGGIQSYLYDLWRRLPPGETTVLTTPYAGAAAWDAEQKFRVVRTRQRVLLPTRALARDVDAVAHEVRADVIFIDPMLPLGI